MEGQFTVDRGAHSTMQQRHQAAPGLDPNQPVPPSQFANQVTRLLGDDAEPDPLFFEESWTVGVPAALENWRQRQQRQSTREPDRASSCGAFPQLHNLSSQMFIEQREAYAQHFPSAHAASQYASWPMHAPQVPASAASAATSTQSPAPQPAQQPCETFADAHETIQHTTCPMTLHRACTLLGVTATSSLEQIKSAYRRMVSQWHPDRLEHRLEHGNEEGRRLATEQMSAINNAYRLLRSTPRQQAA